MKIIADNKIPYLKGVFEPYAEVMYKGGAEINSDDVRDADALIIRTRTKCNGSLLDGSSVKFIATATIGYDHIDKEYCKANNIQWVNAPGCNSSSVQQYIASALLWLAVNEGIELKDRTLGVVGVGNVGRKVVRLAEIMGMRVLLNDPPRARKEGDCGFVSLDTIIDECDIISFHVPLNYEGTDKTYHLIDKKLISKLSQKTILINSSRGEVVDNPALKNALIQKNIDGAVLDVWENEPDIDPGLLQLVDIGTPHIAGYSRDGKANGTAMSVQAVSRFFGLGIENWYPEEIEMPKDPEIAIDGKDMDHKQIIYKLVTHTYDIKKDDQALKKNVDDFEKLRGNYPVRREFGSFKVKIKNLDENLISIIRELGFDVF